MPIKRTHFRTHLFSLDATEIALHKNLMTCVIFGRSNPVYVGNEQAKIEADIVCIKPDILHRVIVGEGGAEVMFLDGVQLSTAQANFEKVDQTWQHVPEAFNALDYKTIADFRQNLDGNGAPPDPQILEIVEELYSSPLNRMSQDELSTRLGLERTQALRHFKAVTGQTFRKFKKWAASVAVTHSAHQGQEIGIAGIDAGFSDASHTTRTAGEVFGLTPTHGLDNLRNVSTLVPDPS